jgi:hypothetical protein
VARVLGSWPRPLAQWHLAGYFRCRGPCGRWLGLGSGTNRPVWTVRSGTGRARLRLTGRLSPELLADQPVSCEFCGGILCDCEAHRDSPTGKANYSDRSSFI